MLCLLFGAFSNNGKAKQHETITTKHFTQKKEALS